MPGLVPGIHVLNRGHIKDVDGRDKPGHDDVDGFTRFARGGRGTQTRRFTRSHCFLIKVTPSDGCANTA
jgi:hypothetical protein